MATIRPYSALATFALQRYNLFFILTRLKSVKYSVRKFVNVYEFFEIHTIVNCGASQVGFTDNKEPFFQLL